MLLDIPPEITLHILSFLDLPDLAALSHVSPSLAKLCSDPVLHRFRLLVVAPSRLSHSLFGQSPEGLALRPTVRDLVNRGVLRGLGIVRRWRAGSYFYSPHSVKQYENGIRLQRRHTCLILSSHLRQRSASAPAVLQTLHQSHVLPDIESSTLAISRTLLPVVRRLKWSQQRDNLAKMVRDRTCLAPQSRDGKETIGFGEWVATIGRGIVQDGERVRLATCPNVKKIIHIYEGLVRRDV